MPDPPQHEPRRPRGQRRASHRLGDIPDDLPVNGGFMSHLLVLGIVAAAALLLLGADRVIKARSRARHLQAMSERLSAATARVDRQQEKRHAEEKKGAALTSVMPAIKRPPLSLPGVEVPDPAPRSRSSREHPAQPDRGPGQ